MSESLERGTARLQVLYLPPVTEGGITRHPYVLVLDNLTAAQAEAITEHGLEPLAQAVGAQSALVLTFPVEVL